MTLTNHLEKYLGHITEGWSPREDPSPIRVVRFGDQPTVDVSTYVSLGLSDHRLRMPTGREVRHELMFAVRDEFPTEQVASFVMTSAEYLLGTHRGLARGEVIGPYDPLIQDLPADAIYAAAPVVFPEKLHVYSGMEPPVVFVWLVPLMRDEASFVKSEGWKALEALLEEKDPDLFDLRRASVLASFS